MVKTITGFGLIIGALTVLMQPDISNACIALLFAGVLPGTNTVLPFWVMITIIGFIAIIALTWLMHQPVFIGDNTYKEKQAKAKARHDVLRSHNKSAQPHPKRRTRKRYQPVTSS